MRSLLTAVKKRQVLNQEKQFPGGLMVRLKTLISSSRSSYIKGFLQQVYVNININRYYGVLLIPSKNYVLVFLT